MIREIVTDAEVLGYRADEVDVRKDNKKIRDTVVILKDIIKETGITALSAPQVGENIRLFVINFNGKMRSFVNPIITATKGLELSREICSSLPGKTYIRPRHNNINVTYQTPLGKIESKNFVGKAAIVFQHHVDHLDGLLLSDIGLEIDEDFDKASEEERYELVNAYMDSLDIKRKEAEEAIQKDEDLKQLSDAITYMEKIQAGEIELNNEPEEKKEKVEEEEKTKPKSAKKTKK